MSIHLILSLKQIQCTVLEEDTEEKETAKVDSLAAAKSRRILKLPPNLSG